MAIRDKMRENAAPHLQPGETIQALRIGPAQGLWYKTDALGEMMWIHKRFHKDVAAADEAANLA